MKKNYSFLKNNIILLLKSHKSICFSLLTLFVCSFANAQTNTWDGSNSTNWNTAANWSRNEVPTAMHNVVIPNVTNKPIISVAGTTAVCNNITIDPSATLTLANNATALLNIYGNFTNNGTLASGTLGTVGFLGTSNAIIGGTSPTTFRNLTINKDTPTATVTNSARAFSVGNNLTVTRGNLILTAIDTDYSIGNDLTVAVDGTLSHNVNWSNNKKIDVAGSIAIDGAYSYVGSALINMNTGGKTIRTGTTALSFLTFSRATGDITAIGPVTVNHNFWSNWNISGTGKFITGNNIITANAGLNNAGGSILINGGTLNVTGGLNIGFVSNPGAVTLSNGTLNADAVIVGDGTNLGTFTHTGGTANIGDLIINGGTKANVYTCAGTPTINISGSWTNNKTFTAASSTVNFVGTSAQTINGTLSGNTGKFYNLTFNGLGGSWTNNAPIDVANKLTMTNGILTTSTTNLLNVTNNAAAAITGGSATSFINGPVNWTTSLNTTYNFPVGKGTTYLPFVLKTNRTTATPSQVEAFNSGSGGTPNFTIPTVTATVGSLSTTEYWSLDTTTGNFTTSVVSLSRPTTAITPLDLIAGSATVTGTYTSLSGTVGANGITASTAIGTNRFFVLGRKNGIRINGSITGSPFCAGSSVSVPFKVTWPYTGTNVFTAQLSDASGSFASPVDIGNVPLQLTGVTNPQSYGTISATIPAGITTGTGYRIRVVSSVPNVIGEDNGVNLIINDKPTIASITAPAALCSGSSLSLSAPTVTANGSTVSSQGWEMSTTVGGSTYVALGVSYTVAFLDNGKNIRYTATNGCGVTTSNVVAITVNNVPTIAAISVPLALCSGGSLNPTVPVVTANGSTVTASGWQLETTVGGGAYSNLTFPYTVAFTDNGKKIRYYATNSCGTTYSNEVIVTINDAATIAAISAPAAFCVGGSLNPTAPIVTANGSTVTASGWQLETTVGSEEYSNLTFPYTVAFTDNGKKIRYYATNGCITTYSNLVTITVNPIPATPIFGTITNANCVISTGSIVLNGLPSGSWTINQIGTVPRSYTGNTPSFEVTGLISGNYSFTVSNSNGCPSPATDSQAISSDPSTTWNGGAWSNGDPTILKAIIFDDDFTSSANIEGCSCQVTNNAKVVIKSAHTLTVTNQVDVIGGGTLTFDNNASLVQTKDAAENVNTNSGNIIYHRHTDFVRRYDFTYWSSPVVGEKLYNVSPTTLGDKFYGFNANINNWEIYYNGNKVMESGEGYLIRAPQSFDITVPAIDINPKFTGKPNNGVITKTLAAGKLYLLGNPYPSALDADQFLDKNSTVLAGTLYFWTHNTAIQLASNITNGTAGSGVYAYTSDDYASYNRTGGVGTGKAASSETGTAADVLKNTPTGKIASGQGFFVYASTTGGKVEYNNGMRVSGNNTQFFKLNTTSKTTTTIEKNRVWLNMTNKQGAFKQALIGYITGATNDYEGSFDGVSFDGNTFLDFYSINQKTNLSIQGRALPFQKKDSVALGYKSAIKGEFQISIDATDGVLASQNIFVEDQDLKVLHDLKKEPYTFSTEVGTFNNRFVLRYVDKNVVEIIPEPEAPEVLYKDVLVSVQNGQVKVNSPVELIDKVILYDMVGRKIYQKNKVAANELVIPHLLSSNQVLLVDILLSNGTKLSRKIVY